MHAVDIAAMTTKAGNTFYDIETGSALTYPCPIRFVDLRRSTVGGETNTYMSVSTKTHTGPIHYTDPTTGTAHVIDDLTEYAREFGFSTDMLKTVAGDFVKSFFGKYLPNDTWPVTKIVANIDQIIDDVAAVPIADGKDLLDFANWIYQCNLAGEDDGNYPAWVQSGVDQLKSGALLDQVLDIVAKDAFGRGSVLFTKFQGLFTRYLKSQLNDTLKKLYKDYTINVNVKLNYDNSKSEYTIYTPSVAEDGTSGGMIESSTKNEGWGGIGSLSGVVGTTSNSDISPNYPTIKGDDDNQYYYQNSITVKRLVNTEIRQLEKNGYSVDKITAAVTVDQLSLIHI